MIYVNCGDSCCGSEVSFVHYVQELSQSAKLLGRFSKGNRASDVLLMDPPSEEIEVDRKTGGETPGAVATIIEPGPSHFIRNIVTEDIAQGKNDGRVHTRFPPEPNGYLHIGHAKSICLNFGLAGRIQRALQFRFDDTNPSKENVEYVESIKEDVRWLGFDWDDREYYASDYFAQLYQYAIQLIEAGQGVRL